MGVIYNPKIVTDGLVLCLDAGNKRSYPGAGTTWTDLRGGNNGALANDASFNSANGGGIVLDGTNDYIEIQDLEETNTTNVSFSVGLKLDNLSSDYDIISKGQHQQYRPILCFFDRGVGSPANVGAGNTNAISCLTYDGDTQIWVSTSSNIMSADEIFILDITIDASAGTLSLYKNGTFLNSYTNSNYDGMQNTANNFRLGADINTSKDLPGTFYFFRIYNRALTADEILQNYNATKGRYL
jgi:hypothetical protein|tara:strand:- start:95 stop:817 length:723 start_codon:yes stop_codon:yes gene_type:complete